MHLIPCKMMWQVFGWVHAKSVDHHRLILSVEIWFCNFHVTGLSIGRVLIAYCVSTSQESLYSYHPRALEVLINSLNKIFALSCTS
jgi:hypothetical protein